jgi:hypothetical protein
VEVALISEACALISDQRLVHAGAVDMAAQQAGGAVAFNMRDAVSHQQIIKLGHTHLRRDQRELTQPVIAKIASHHAA